MIKKQQKWIALLVVCTFVWLLQVSSMPLNAAGTQAQVGSANSEQGPDYYEAVSHKAAPAKKSSILPIILIAAGVITITAVVLFLFVLKNYDIVGVWAVTVNWENGALIATFDATFTGDKKSGTVKTTSNTGSYTVDGKTAKWDFSSIAHYTGTFDSKTTMTGTMNNNGGSTGTFTATKTSSPSSWYDPNAGDPATGTKTRQ
jgi:hypothetical protein